MLKLLKRMEKTRNVLLIAFSVLLVLSLIVFGAISGNMNPTNLASSTKTAVTVGNEVITVGDIYTEQERMQRLSRQPFAPPAQTTAGRMIDARIIKQEAEKLGLTATDEEVARQIRDSFTQGGQEFNRQTYETNAARQAGSVDKFEDSVREQISTQKLAAFLTSSVTISDSEVMDLYKRQNSKFTLSYVNVNAAEITKTLEPSDEDLKAYFDKNKKDYYISLPQKKVKYLFLNTAKVGEKLEITDKILEEEYKKLTDEQKQKGVKVQEIVLRIAKPEFENDVLTTAQGIIKSLNATEGKVDEETFAKQAQGKSERPGTASNGGRVPGLVTKQLDPTKQDDPYQRTLTMKEGEITEPIKFGTNYYILRRGETVNKTVEESKKVIETGYRARQSYTANAALAEKVATEFKKSKDIDATAEKFAEDANSSKEEMIKETDYVKPGDDIGDFGNSQEFHTAIQNLEKNGDIGDKVSVPGGFAIPILADKKEPRDATFDEVKTRVEEAYKVAKAREKLESTAKAIASSAGSAGGLGGAATANGLKAAEQKDYTLGTPLGEGPSATTSEALQDAIFSLKEGEVTEKPVKIGDNYLVVGVTAREDADEDKFKDSKDQLSDQLLNQKRQAVFQDFVIAKKNEYEQKKLIVFNKDALADIDNFNNANRPTTPQTPPPGIPGQPGGGQIPPELLERLQQQQQQQQQNPPAGQ